MEDLRDSLKELLESKDSPKKTRKAFAEFVNLSQRLTSVMRKNSETRWNAVEFQGWNEITDLFKKMRNYEEHVEIIKSEIQQTASYTMTDKGSEGVTLCMRRTIKNVDPLSRKVPTANVVLYEADPVTGRMTNKRVETERAVTSCFNVLIAETNQKGRAINKLLDKINNTEICFLASNCYATLCEYYKFYQYKQRGRGKRS